MSRAIAWLGRVRLLDTDAAWPILAVAIGITAIIVMAQPI